jgi:hypothetical protein
VNQVIWHGKPYNPAGQDTVKFYASVHVGKSGSLAAEIPAFNSYLEQVSYYMKKGKTFSEVAVYLPTEDSWVAGELPVEKQFIWAWGEYEQRYTCLPEELKAYRPLWINGEFLKKAEFKNGRLVIGDLSFSALYIDVKFMDKDALQRVEELAEQGLSICLKKIPAEPGLHKSKNVYEPLLEKLGKLNNVKSSWAEMENITPFITGTEKFDYWCREADEGFYIFMANPKSKHLTFPLEYGQSLNFVTETCSLEISFNGLKIPVKVDFNPYQSLLLFVSRDGKVTNVDIRFAPKLPIYHPREKRGKEKWEVK